MTFIPDVLTYEDLGRFYYENRDDFREYAEECYETENGIDYAEFGYDIKNNLVDGMFTETGFVVYEE